jgi:hypothetical protein
MKRISIATLLALASLVMLLVISVQARADGKGELQKYFSDASHKVKATDSPAEKRNILNQSFHTMNKVLDMVEDSPTVSKADLAGINLLKASLRDKQNELAGTNGYTRVPDERLNAFSDYVVQDMEQADQIITISLVTLLLIIILIVLLIK